MAIVTITGASVTSHFSKQAAECTSSAAAIAEGAIKAVQVVQAFDAFESLTTDHQNHLTSAMKKGVKKAVAGAVSLGSILFVA